MTDSQRAPSALTQLCNAQERMGERKSAHGATCRKSALYLLQEAELRIIIIFCAKERRTKNFSVLEIPNLTPCNKRTQFF